MPSDVADKCPGTVRQWPVAPSGRVGVVSLQQKVKQSMTSAPPARTQ